MVRFDLSSSGRTAVPRLPPAPITTMFLMLVMVTERNKKLSAVRMMKKVKSSKIMLDVQALFA